MIKVLMSSTTPVIRDGVTGVMLNLYKNIDKEKFHIDFVAINEPDEDLKKSFISDGSNMTIIPREIKHPLRYILQYAKCCKGYDIVHVHGNSATMVLEMLAAKLAGVHVRVAHSHNTYCVSKTIDKVFRPLFYALCNVRLACGGAAGKWLFGKRKFSIVNNGIDTERFMFDSFKRTECREDLNLNDAIVIGNIANFLSAKNHLFLIDIFNELFQLNSSCRLILIGTGELMKKAKDKVAMLGIEPFVLFTGSVNDVTKFLNAMDVVIMPSLNEGFPLTLVEEQANGLTCYVSDAITKKVNLTGNVQFLPLKNSALEWATHINKDYIQVFDRSKKSKESIEMIRENYYDIKDAISRLERIYISLGEK